MVVCPFIWLSRPIRPERCCTSFRDQRPGPPGRGPRALPPLCGSLAPSPEHAPMRIPGRGPSQDPGRRRTSKHPPCTGGAGGRWTGPWDGSGGVPGVAWAGGRGGCVVVHLDGVLGGRWSSGFGDASKGAFARRLSYLLLARGVLRTCHEQRIGGVLLHWWAQGSAVVSPSILHNYQPISLNGPTPRQP